VTITVVGLGPGSPALLTAGALEALSAASVVYLRTRVHPTVPALPAGPEYRSFDHVYESAPDFESAYGQIVDELLAAAAGGDVVYAVPGDPMVAEATVRQLLERSGEVAIGIISGVSFVEPVLAVLRLDALQRGLQLLDAGESRFDAQRPALFAQVYNQRLASHLKLALLDVYPPDHVVQLVSGAGGGEAKCEASVLSQMDRDFPFDHLSCVYVPALRPEQDLRSFAGLEAIVRRLHAPDGCPWDRDQTHDSLKPHLLEESYEVLDVLDSGDVGRLPEELGDLLLQVLMHAAVSERQDEFLLRDVFEGIAAKLVRRHPHVFGDVVADTPEQVYQNWEQLKQVERGGGGGALDGVPASMPALSYSQAVQARARRLGFDWPDLDGPLDKLAEELGELAEAPPDEQPGEFGDVLFTLVAVAAKLGIDAEEALRLANRKFHRRFSRMEALAVERGLDLSALPLAEQDRLWDEAKSEGL
jgi:tetrapyrrole methylase family protein/MazG family protein